MQTRFDMNIQREERKRLKAEKEQKEREQAQKDQDDINDQILWDFSSSGYTIIRPRSKTPRVIKTRSSLPRSSQTRSEYVSLLLVTNKLLTS